MPSAAPSEEHELLSNEQGVTTIGLRVAESTVGELRFKPRDSAPDPGLLRMVTTLLALEVERTRAPEQAGEAALGSFVNALLDGEIERPARPDRARRRAGHRPRRRIVRC